MKTGREMKILLVQPPMEEFYLTQKRTIPYGLASIGASLERHGFIVRIFDALARVKSKSIDLPGEFSHLLPYYGRQDISLFSLFHQFRHFGYSHGHIGSIARKEKPFLIGISSLFTPYGDQALKTAKTVKKFFPQAHVVMGGHHPTCFPKQVLKHREVDFIIRGEGEVSLPKLCNALAENKGIENIPGIGFRKGDKYYISEPSWVEDLDMLPLPAFNHLNQKFYQRRKKGAITVVSTRGCPMPCSYCSISSTSDHAGFRQRSVENVLKEIKYQARVQDLGFIDFEDENLTLNKKWFLALLAGIRKIFLGKKVELRAMNGLFPPSLDKEIIKAMKRAGFQTLNLSVGSFCPEQLHRFKRPDVRQAHDRVLELAAGQGLTTVSYIIAGAPGQDPFSSLEDLLALAQRRTLAGLSVFYPAPGSHDFNVCKNLGLLPSQFSLLRSTAMPLDHTTSRLQAVTLLRLARILNFIKSLLDEKKVLPEPGLCDQTRICLNDRKSVSLSLLKWFLYDGKIRGVDNKGHVYLHNIDENLSKKFAEKIMNIQIHGVTGKALPVP